MAISIECNGKQILRIKNLSFDLLQKTIMSIIETKKLIVSSEMQELLERMDQDTYGLGMIYVDIAKYLKDPNDFFLLASLINEAIEIEKISFTYFVGMYENLKNFAHEIEEYSKYLEQNKKA